MCRHEGTDSGKRLLGNYFDSHIHSSTQEKPMTRPNGIIIWMFVFTSVILLIALLLSDNLEHAFYANVEFNSLIIGVWLIGVLINFRQVIALYREIEWINAFRRSDPERPIDVEPRLLAPMARMLASRERGKFSLSAVSMRSLLDSIQTRLDEANDISRYMIGLLVFLGLLGTFWGLLQTVTAVAGVINSMSIDSAGSEIFESLKQGLLEPLAGMGVAFSSSLFGLAGSLVLGFYDLQAGHAQNRFYNELEEWLSSVTHLSTGGVSTDGQGGVPAYVEALLEQTADNLNKLQLTFEENEQRKTISDQHILQLTTELGRLTKQMSNEGRHLQLLTEDQADIKTLLRQLAEGNSSGHNRLSEDLSREIRLLSRTLAHALGPQAQDKDS